MNTQRGKKKKTSRIILERKPKEEKNIGGCRGSIASNTTNRSRQENTEATLGLEAIMVRGHC